MYTVLAIETSCDETGLSYVQTIDTVTYTCISSVLHSQADTHAPYGGVFPMLAKREHGHNILGLLAEIIQKTENQKTIHYTRETYTESRIEKSLNYLSREQELYDICKKDLENSESVLYKKPNINTIAVTQGPGLEPALWVGISFAKFLATLWNISILPINHMEGHLASVLLSKETESSKNINFPALGLLISGGHTELLYIEKWGNYTIIGQTRDDAVGEAYDKAARILGLNYPGGPEISKRAQSIRETYAKTDIDNMCAEYSIKLPRPMCKNHDLDFSFSGLKTAVLYLVQDIQKKENITTLTESITNLICYEFEEAVSDVIIYKLEEAYIKHTNIQTVIVAGGVIANTYIRTHIENWSKKHGLIHMFPSSSLATDNAVMIGLAAVQGLSQNKETFEPIDTSLDTLIARGGWRIDEII